MLILINIENIERPESNDPNELARKAFNIANSQYNEDADVSDAYLYNPDDETTCAEELNLVDGRSDPDKIKEIAANWNSSIEAEFSRCLKALHESAPKNGNGINWLNAERHNIYMLKKAARALDNDFESFADHGLLLNKNRYFTVQLTDEQLCAIIDNPGAYVCIEVTTK